MRHLPGTFGKAQRTQNVSKGRKKAYLACFGGPPEPLFGENLRSSYAQLALGEAESFIPVR